MTLLASLPAVASAAPQKTDQLLPPVQLRGLGTVSGTQTSLQPQVGKLSVQLTDVAKARLLHAKYLSDLTLLPGVSTSVVTAGKLRVTTYNIADQGCVAALRDGDQLHIFTAPDSARLKATLTTAALPDSAVSQPEVKVPMWLDRWDKFGFRFYYRPWELPEGKSLANYDFPQEFEYARQQDRAGFVFWNEPMQTDSAEGLMSYGWYDWAQREAKAKQVPVGINSTSASPTWLLNRYRDQTKQKMPGFTGNFHRIMSPYLGGQGSISWNSPEGEDAVLGVLQPSIRRFAADENVTSFLEPHGELYHGKQDIFLEYGPVADANFRRFLQAKYATPGAVGKRWGQPIANWNDIRVPEVAHFAGWGPQAIDVSGDWRVGYEELLGQEYTYQNYPEREIQRSKPAPSTWFEPSFDDAGWPTINTQSDDRQLFTPKRPAVFRRSFDVPARWKETNKRVWLYVWDMNLSTRDQVRAVLNGKPVGSNSIQFNTPHWSAFEVTEALQTGQNLLALRLPQGYLGYRTYLSSVEPRQYPDLGRDLNSEWVDFADFTQWSRLQACRRGMEMIRQVDANRQITLMHPDEYADGIKSLALDYGGNFHNTGWMGAFWGDYLPAVMRGAGLPFSLEPGGPAKALPEFKKQLGLYQTEGIQGIDYFIHIGSIMWNDEMRQHFESYRKQIGLLGKYHYPVAETAVLYSDRQTQLASYPWGRNANTDLGGGYWQWNAGSLLRGNYAYDGLTQSSFASGDANKYRVIVDSNTSVMDESTVGHIEAWVKNGGTFVTLAQSGRHTPEIPNSWPISRLTGYKVTKIDALNEDGGVAESGQLQPAPGQTVFGSEVNGLRGNGLHLQKQATDTKDLLLWNDGSVAAGYRPLGKGYIVQLGAKFTGNKIFDRIEPGGYNPEFKQLRTLITDLLKWRQVASEPVRLAEPNEFVILRPAVTNNGLYDVWTLWNQSPDRAQTVSLQSIETSPSTATDFHSGQKLNLQNGKLENVTFEPLETRVFLVPRRKITQAPLDWFQLQRQWWRGTKTPNPKPFPAPNTNLILDLSDGWKFQSVTTDATPLLVVAVDDSGWKTKSLGAWNTATDGGHAVLRKTFTVPSNWKSGRISLWLTSWYNTSFAEKGRIFLDGKEIRSLSSDAIQGREYPTLLPGTKHVLAMEVQSAGSLAGLRGQGWLAYEPAATEKLDLAGGWEPSLDALRYGSEFRLPGAFDAQLMRRSFHLDAKYKGKLAYLTVDGSTPLVGAIINGQLIRRHHHMLGERWSLNVTPYLKFGQENQIQLVVWEGPRTGLVREVSLGFFKPGER